MNKRYYFSKGDVRFRVKPCLVIDNPPNKTVVCTQTGCYKRDFIGGPRTERPELFKEISEEEAIKLVFLYSFIVNPRD